MGANLVFALIFFGEDIFLAGIFLSMNEQILKTVETDMRLSESCLWDSQKNFYLTQGMNAWNGQVPFFITSNIFFAQECARVLVSYCRDLLDQQDQQDQKKLDLNQPIYILELGAGTGQFSFYCLQELNKLWEEFELKKFTFKKYYLMGKQAKRGILSASD